MRADVHRFTLADPSDVSGLAKAIAAGTVDPATIVAVIGKTHGNGLVNDYTRGYLTLSLSILIGEASARSAETVREQVPFIFSGGGRRAVAALHRLHRRGRRCPAGGRGKSAGDRGRLHPADAPLRDRPAAQIDVTAAAVTEAVAKSNIDEVHFVQVKGPAFSLADIVDEQKARPASGQRQSGQADGLRPRRRRLRRCGCARRDFHGPRRSRAPC